jgi:hypothetical protein
VFPKVDFTAFAAIMTDLLATKPGAVAPAVTLLAKLRATPSVGALYDDLLKHAKGLVFMSTWKAGIMWVGGQVLLCTAISLDAIILPKAAACVRDYLRLTSLLLGCPSSF